MNESLHSGQRRNRYLPDLTIYQQGGLDSYCSFYALFNLLNFLKFKDSGGKYSDYIAFGKSKSKKDYSVFRSLWGDDDGLGLAKLREELGALGGEGPEGYRLLPVLRAMLKQFGYADAWITLAEDVSVNENRWMGRDKLQRGIERNFGDKTLGASLLGLAVICEGNEDHLGHWVVLVGSDHLKNLGEKVPGELRSSIAGGIDGIVLDSQRGYESWKFGRESVHAIHIARSGGDWDKSVEFRVYSLLSICL